MTHYRPTWVDIDTRAFQKNLRALSRVRGHRGPLMAVLKANAYGHGAVPLARAALRTPGIRLWGFGVSSVEEGLQLRQAGLSHPILILGSLYPFDSFEAALRHRLIPTIASKAAATALGRAARRLRKKAVAHIKVDTGMSRIGVRPSAVKDVLDAAAHESALNIGGVYTHLSKGHHRPTTLRQLSLFNAAVRAVKARWPKALAHAANSGGLINVPESHHDLVRPGLSLYGAFPHPSLKNKLRLSPVLSWKSRVVFVKTVPAGTPVSYGGSFVTSKRSRLATLPVGYADGYRRSLSNRSWVLIQGRPCPVRGRVTMDQIVVDVTGVPGVDVGTEAVLIGTQGGRMITVEQMARWAGTISYEVLCGITSRVART